MEKTSVQKWVMNKFRSERDGESMRKQVARATTLDWQILSDDAPWDEPGVIADHTGSGGSLARVHSRRLGAIAILFVVVVAGVALHLWRTAEAGAQLLEAELRTTVAAGQNSADLAGLAATVRVQDIIYLGNVASVQVETTHVDPDGQTYITRQRSFYSPSSVGWVRVPSSSVYLGEAQSRETEFFTFFYHPMDAAAVEAITADLDAVYADLRQDYGLPPPRGRIGRRNRRRADAVELNYLCQTHKPVPPISGAGVAPVGSVGDRRALVLALECARPPAPLGRAQERFPHV